jgi:peroxiredoxin
MKNKRSLWAVAAMVLLLLVISFGFQYMNTPHPSKAEKNNAEHEDHDHPSISGVPAGDFTMPSVNGSIVKLSDLKGKYNVILFFSNIKDPNLMKLIPAAQRLEKKYADNKIKCIIVTSLYPIAAVRDFAHKNHIQINLLADKTGAVSMQYLEAGESNAFLIDINGKIYAPIKYQTPEDIEANADALIKAMISGKPAPNAHEHEHEH